MACVGLSQLHRGWHEQTVCARVSRLWHYRGGLENGPVKLMHMVLLDADGGTGYAVVSTDFLNPHLHVLAEGVVYEFSHFFVRPRQLILNPTDAPVMIAFVQSTTVTPRFHLNDVLPEWTYNLTPIDDLPQATDTPESYVDVIGVITAISPIESFTLPYALPQVMKRRVLLTDHNGHEVAITLLGERAVRFNGQSIRFMGQEDPAVAIFVGTTVCTYQGAKELSAGCACRWYINEDISDVNIFRSRLPASFPAITDLPTPSSIVLQAQHAQVYPRKLLAVLLNINLYQKEPGSFRCKVTISRIPTDKNWWGTFCTACNSLSMPAGSSTSQPNVYTCSRHSCSCTTATIRYTLFLIARDHTGEAEFSLYGSTAEHIVGLSAMQVIRNSTQHGPDIPNVHVAASCLRKTPSELTSLLAMRCEFIVRISAGSFFGRRPNFQVTAVESFQAIRPNLSVVDLVAPS